MKKLIQITGKVSDVITFLKLIRRFIWVILILISVFFWITAFFIGLVTDDSNLQNIFSALGYLVIVFTFGWFTYKNPLIVEGFSLSAWILVGLVCLFFASLLPNTAPFLWMIWPTLSAIFAAWPDFRAADNKIKNLSNEQRLKLLIWFLSHLVVSCWINFSLIIQTWILDYPSLLADDFSQSDFVVKIQLFSSPTTGGERVLNTMERQLKTHIDGKTWVLAETWLKNTNQPEELLAEAKKQISGVKEKELWKFRTEVTAQKTGYNLLMIAEWQGPSYNPQGYLLKKVCQVNSMTQQPTPANTNLGRRVRRNNNARVATTPQGRVIAKPVKVANVQCQSVSQQIIRENQLKTSPKL